MSEYASMGNYIMDGKSFEDCVKDGHVPDNDHYREEWDELEQEIREMEANGEVPDFSYDGTDRD